MQRTVTSFHEILMESVKMGNLSVIYIILFLNKLLNFAIKEKEIALKKESYETVF